MIKIASYQEVENSKEIYDRYLYLLASILPFAPEEILGKDEIEIKGRKISANNFLLASNKRPRKRTTQYISLLKEHLKKQILAEDKTTCFWEDQLLAAKLIKAACEDLFYYLYDDSQPEYEPKLRDGKLRKLLFAKMDCLDEELQRLPIIDDKKNSDLLQEHVFRYREFSASRLTRSIIKDMDVKVCPYCNCQYTPTVDKENKHIRPQLDHYKCKSKYPYYAVTLMNLVPSCPSCNQRKKDEEKEVLYPYSDEMGTDFFFRTKMKEGVRYLLGDENASAEFELELTQANPFNPNKLAGKVKNSDEILGLTDIYNTHKGYILLLFRKHYIYNETYLEMLHSTFEGLFHNTQEMKEIFYVMDTDPSKWGNRPLSKLTHDIDQEIEELFAYSKLKDHTDQNCCLGDCKIL